MMRVIVKKIFFKKYNYAYHLTFHQVKLDNVKIISVKLDNVSFIAVKYIEDYHMVTLVMFRFDLAVGLRV